MARNDTKGLVARLAKMETELIRSRDAKNSARRALKASKKMLREEKAARFEDRKALEKEKENGKRTKDLLEELLDGQRDLQNSRIKSVVSVWPQHVMARDRDTYMYFGGGLGITAASAAACFHSRTIMNFVMKNGFLAFAGKKAGCDE